MEDAHANGPKRDEAGFRVAGVCRNVKRRERNGKHGSEFIFYCEDHELEISEVRVRAVCTLRRANVLKARHKGEGIMCCIIG